MVDILAQRSLSFAKEIGEQWKESEGIDSKSYQRRFLYVNAFAAYCTAQSYWLLHASNHFNDCRILARNLLERMFNCGLAVKSSEHAVGLMAAELSEKIRHMELLRQPPFAWEELAVPIQNLNRQLAVLLGLLRRTEAEKWSPFRRAREAGLLHYYRFGYFDLSRYAHAGYEVSRPEEYGPPSKSTDFIALFAPVFAAAQCHAVDCSCASSDECHVRQKFDALVRDLSLGTLGNSNATMG